MQITTPITWRRDELAMGQAVWVADHVDLHDSWIIVQLTEFSYVTGYVIRRDGIKIDERRTLKLAKEYVARWVAS